MATLKYNKMRKLIMNSVMLLWLACVEGGRAFVNVFKKKNCGASPLNGEITLRPFYREMLRRIDASRCLRQS